MKTEPLALARNELVIRDGIVAMRDGSSVAEYLAKCGLKEGDDVNVCRHDQLVATIEAAQYEWSA